jgi:hypothetical protein
MLFLKHSVKGISMKPAVKVLSTISAVALLATLSVTPAMAATSSIQTSGAVSAAPIVQEQTELTGVSISVPVAGTPAFVIGNTDVDGNNTIYSGSILTPGAPVISGTFANLDPAVDYGFAQYTVYESTTAGNGTTVPAGAIQIDSGNLKVASGAFSITSTVTPLLTSQDYLSMVNPTYANGVVSYGAYNRFYTVTLEWPGTADRTGFSAASPVGFGAMQIAGGSVAPVSAPPANIPPIAAPMPGNPPAGQPGGTVTSPTSPGAGVGPNLNTGVVAGPTGPGSTAAGGSGTKASEANKGGNASAAVPGTSKNGTQPLIDTGVAQTDSPSSIFLILGLLGISGAAVTLGAIRINKVDAGKNK